VACYCEFFLIVSAKKNHEGPPAGGVAFMVFFLILGWDNEKGIQFPW
jgi:hypothetical protein